MTRYDVRPATPSDAGGLGEVHVRVWHETYTGLMPADFLARLSVDDSTERWRGRLAEPVPGTVTVVATADGVPVGFATAGPSRDEPADPPEELYAVNVLAAHHGTGVGRRLVAAALAAVAPDRPVSLWVLRGNERAMAFYRRLGLSPDGTTKAHPGTGLLEERWTGRPSL